MWCVAELNEDYITKMEDVLATYERPYDPAEPVVCLDEKPVALHADVRPARAAAPGREARRDNEYRRCGTANVFCAVEPKAGRHFTFPTPDRSGFQFARVTVELALAYQQQTHRRESAYRRLPPRQPDNPRPVRQHQRNVVVPVPLRLDIQPPRKLLRLAQKLAALPRARTHYQGQAPRHRVRLMNRFRRGYRRLTPLPRAIQQH